jgi:hypothetical protein
MAMQCPYIGLSPLELYQRIEPMGKLQALILYAIYHTQLMPILEEHNIENVKFLQGWGDKVRGMVAAAPCWRRPWLLALQKSRLASSLGLHVRSPFFSMYTLYSPGHCSKSLEHRAGKSTIYSYLITDPIGHKLTKFVLNCTYNYGHVQSVSVGKQVDIGYNSFLTFLLGQTLKKSRLRLDKIAITFLEPRRLVISLMQTCFGG